VPKVVEQRRAELMHTCKSELVLPFVTRDAADAQAGCAGCLNRMIKQYGEPHARLSSQHERAALTVAGGLEQPLESSDLAQTI
jgi:hypothetical protein